MLNKYLLLEANKQYGINFEVLMLDAQGNITYN